jgi:hypothetical protein
MSDRFDQTKDEDMSAERRIAERKDIDQIIVSELTSLSNYNVIAHTGTIIDASSSGFLVVLQRTEVVPKEYRDSLSLDPLIGHQVVMFLPQMNLDLDGTIIRTEHKGKGRFEVAITFSSDVPEYWRDCLVDLLPAPGEMKE